MKILNNRKILLKKFQIFNFKTNIIMKFHIDLFVIKKSKATITLNSMFQIVGIMKINERKINQRIYECRIWFNDLKYIKTCFF